MLKEWQFNVLFFVGVLGAVLLLIGPELGLNISTSPTAVTGVGAILTYVLTQRGSLTKKPKDEDIKDEDKKDDTKDDPKQGVK